MYRTRPITQLGATLGRRNFFHSRWNYRSAGEIDPPEYDPRAGICWTKGKVAGATQMQADSRNPYRR
jgi:hypothetical protein